MLATHYFCDLLRNFYLLGLLETRLQASAQLSVLVAAHRVEESSIGQNEHVALTTGHLRDLDPFEQAGLLGLPRELLESGLLTPHKHLLLFGAAARQLGRNFLGRLELRGLSGVLQRRLVGDL